MEGILFFLFAQTWIRRFKQKQEKIKKNMAATKPCPRKKRKKDRHKI